jgi:hypothetical protein
LYFDPDGFGHIVGLIVKSGEGKITLLPTKKLHGWLQRFLNITRYIFGPCNHHPGTSSEETWI